MPPQKRTHQILGEFQALGNKSPEALLAKFLNKQATQFYEHKTNVRLEDHFYSENRIQHRV